jgi:putative addiction module component (TIGR02574 family)
MTPKTLRDAALQLPPEERLQLIEELWDSLVATPEAVPVPQWHKDELQRRMEHPAPGPSLSWEEVQAQARKRKG